MSPLIACVALAVPLNKTFDYLIGEITPIVGARVRVSFGRQEKIGVVVALKHDSDCPIHQLKPLKEVIDLESIWSTGFFELLHWANQYYHYPLGEVCAAALPTQLRNGASLANENKKVWQITALGQEKKETLSRSATKQKMALTILSRAHCSDQALREVGITTPTLNALIDKGWIEQIEAPKEQAWQTLLKISDKQPKLNQEQAIAVAAIKAKSGFHCFLLDGITGSGKTEVYLQAIAQVLSQGRQALVLVPEIGLTPQTIARFQQRFNAPIQVLHSGLSDSERGQAWREARANECAIIIGTRSAVFSPCSALGIIILDEEHDLSYKQHDSFRYHARDIAVKRAHQENIPIILGSATPSLESLQNAFAGKYHHLRLTARAGAANLAQHQLLDLRGQKLQAGLSHQLIQEMKTHLNAGNQVMLFLNRRGFAPVLMCHECGWIGACPCCDRQFTIHHQMQSLRCHHCGAQRAIPHQCHPCGSTQLFSLGVGTEQLEAHLATQFPDKSIVRIDRDNTRRKGSLGILLDEIQNQKHQILIGTQMLAKGHHFPHVTLVALIDVDGALFSTDFRAAERLAQLFTQVAGRAGRASKPGKVMLQTHHPEHPLLHTLLHHPYSDFAKEALLERQDTQLPPFSFMVLFRAESEISVQAEQFLEQVRIILSANPVMDNEKYMIGPYPAPIAKRASRFRWQLLFQTDTRRKLQQAMAVSITAIEHLPLAKKVRWSLDIEPQDLS